MLYPLFVVTLNFVLTSNTAYANLIKNFPLTTSSEQPFPETGAILSSDLGGIARLVDFVKPSNDIIPHLLLMAASPGRLQNSWSQWKGDVASAQNGYYNIKPYQGNQRFLMPFRNNMAIGKFSFGTVANVMMIADPSYFLENNAICAASTEDMFSRENLNMANFNPFYGCEVGSTCDASGAEGKTNEVTSANATSAMLALNNKHYLPTPQYSYTANGRGVGVFSEQSAHTSMIRPYRMNNKPRPNSLCLR